MNKLVFVFEPDEKLCSSLEKLLVSKGYTVIPGVNSKDALKSFNVNPTPGLILIDSNLPETGGLALCQEIRKEKRAYEVPFLIMKTSKTNVEHFRQIGFVDFIDKPLKVNEVLDKVEKIVKYGSVEAGTNKKNIKDILKVVGAIILLFLAVVFIFFVFFGHMIFK